MRACRCCFICIIHFWVEVPRADAPLKGLDVTEGVRWVVQQFLKLNCLEKCQAPPRRWAVIPPTEEAELWPFAGISGVEATASPATDFAIAGDVSVAKKEAAGAPRYGKGVGKDLVGH